ncbi:hypothetical protein GCM10027416_04330 [Okibacterium endophyticum]
MLLVSALGLDESEQNLALLALTLVCEVLVHGGLGAFICQVLPPAANVGCSLLAVRRWFGHACSLSRWPRNLGCLGHGVWPKVSLALSGGLPGARTVGTSMSTVPLRLPVRAVGATPLRFGQSSVSRAEAAMVNIALLLCSRTLACSRPQAHNPYTRRMGAGAPG